jgi:hypothetical protein
MSRPVPYTEVIIDPESDLQVHHWAKDMHVQPYELRAAVKLVGPRLSDLPLFRKVGARHLSEGQART